MTPEQDRLRVKKYYWAHAEERRAYRRKFYRENREKELTRARQYRVADPEKRRSSVRKHREKFPEKWEAHRKNYKSSHPDFRRESHLRRKFGMTLAQQNAMLKEQNFCCRICNEYLERICVDHIPDSNPPRVRAILCNFCNSGLGLFRDNPELLREAASYIERFRL